MTAPATTIGCPVHGERRIAGCRLCDLFHSHDGYRVMLGGQARGNSYLPDTQPPHGRRSLPLARSPCLHEGPRVSPAFDCPLGHEDLHGRECAKDHDVEKGHVTRRNTCAACGDYELGPRHLLWHVYPIRGNGAWQLNADRLIARLPLFTGRRIVAVATDRNCDPADAVQAHFAGERIDEWIAVENDGSLREVKTWPLLWPRVADLPGATFWGHAKGVTRPVNRGVSVHRWASLLYAANLDFWPVVQELLGRHPVVGAFRKAGRGFSSRSSFHFSGGVFWVRNDQLDRRWQEIDRQWWGTEAWPGLHWQPEEAGCHFHTGTVPALDLYRLDYVQGVEEEFERWKSQNFARRTRTG